MYRLRALAEANWERAVENHDYHGAAIWRAVKAAIDNLGEIEPDEASAWFDQFISDTRAFMELVDKLRPPRA